MKNIFLIFVFISFIGSSQTTTGLVQYGEIQSMGMGAPVGADYNAILVFSKDKSLYITRQDSLEGGHQYKINSYSNGENSFMQTYVTNEIGFRYYYDKKVDSLYSRDIGFRLVKEEIPDLRWVLHNETKTIGKYICNKATTDFRGRKYTAWYTTEIPLPFGPWKLHGLPGLILEAYDTNKEVFWYFKALEYPSERGYLLTRIDNKNNSWLTFQDYKNFLIKAFKESIVNSRMVSQSAGIESTQSKTMLNTYIEGFDLNEK